MLKETEAELFMRLLAEALENHRVTRQSRLSAQNKAGAERYKRLFVSDLRSALPSLDPQDCFQMMEDKPQDLRNG